MDAKTVAKLFISKTDFLTQDDREKILATLLDIIFKAGSDAKGETLKELGLCGLKPYITPDFKISDSCLVFLWQLKGD